MKTRHLILLAAAVLVLAAPSRAQFAFNMKQYCMPDSASEKATLPAATFAEIVRNSGAGVPEKEACLLPSPAGTLAGYKADYDGDGNKELCLLQHSGPADAGCNAVVFLSPMPDGTYKWNPEKEKVKGVPGPLAVMEKAREELSEAFVKKGTNDHGIAFLVMYTVQRFGAGFLAASLVAVVLGVVPIVWLSRTGCRW